MKRIFYLWIFSISLSCLSQEKNTDEIIYAKIQTLDQIIFSTNLIENYLSQDKVKSECAKETIEQIWREIIFQCNKLIKDFPNSKYLYETLYCKASFEEKLNNKKVAKEFYEKVVLFETSKTSLKNDSLRALANLSIEQKDFISAIKYLDQSKFFTVKYTFEVDNEESDKILEAMYEKCFKGLEKNPKGCL